MTKMKYIALYCACLMLSSILESADDLKISTTEKLVYKSVNVIGKGEM